MGEPVPSTTNGRLTEIRDSETGERLWYSDEPIDRSKISETSQQTLLDAINNSNPDKFMRHVFEILTGQTVEEAQK